MEIVRLGSGLPDGIMRITEDTGLYKRQIADVQSCRYTNSSEENRQPGPSSSKVCRAREVLSGDEMTTLNHTRRMPVERGSYCAEPNRIR